MIRCMCIVQEDQGPAQNQAGMKRLLNDFSQRAFGEPADIHWIEVPKTNGFTAGGPSTSSIVSLTALEPVAQDTRTELLQELCAAWSGATGCSINEVVGIINDPQAA